MAVTWNLTIDCAQPARLAEFWALALGYEPASPPGGFATWRDWLEQFGVPEEEADDLAVIADPDGNEPNLAFLKVPEAKAVKNRLHLDLHVGGGREATPYEVRWQRVTETVQRLTAAGATKIAEVSDGGPPDHVLMADPEGNEFDVL
ncbi:MAG TPA: VOC family protein [Streptosporangiaceae bacterium]